MRIFSMTWNCSMQPIPNAVPHGTRNTGTRKAFEARKAVRSIWVPGERSPNGTVDHLSRWPMLENHRSNIRVTLPGRDSVQH